MPGRRSSGRCSRRVPASIGMGSSLSVPVKLPEPISAGLNLDSRQPDGFAEQDVELARTIAAYAAVALANIQLREVAEQLVDSTSTGWPGAGPLQVGSGPGTRSKSAHHLPGRTCPALSTLQPAHSRTNNATSSSTSVSYCSTRRSGPTGEPEASTAVSTTRQTVAHPHGRAGGRTVTGRR